MKPGTTKEGKGYFPCIHFNSQPTYYLNMCFPTRSQALKAARHYINQLKLKLRP